MAEVYLLVDEDRFVVEDDGAAWATKPCDSVVCAYTSKEEADKARLALIEWKAYSPKGNPLCHPYWHTTAAYEKSVYVVPMELRNPVIGELESDATTQGCP